METNNRLSEEEISEIIEKIRRKNIYDEASIQLIQRDLKSGLSREQTLEYCRVKEWNITQRQLYSNLIHRKESEEVKKTICRDDLSVAQMQVLYNYYFYGVSIGKLKEVLEKDSQPNHMKEIFNRVLDNMGIAIPKDETLVDKVTSDNQITDIGDTHNNHGKNKLDNTENDNSIKAEKEDDISDIIKSMNERMEKQDVLYCSMMKLMEQIVNQNSEEENKGLLKKYNEQEEQLISQQNELNQANRTVVKLRAEKEGLEKQVQLLRELKNVPTEENAAKKKEVNETRNSKGKETGVTEMRENYQNLPYVSNGVLPVCYQVPITNNGRIVSSVEIEHGERKSNFRVGIFSKLFIKKKSRANLVKLLAAGELAPEQLEQIRIAIERGLHEGQLLELINNNVSVGKMKEIIEIAVLENNMA